MDEGPSASTAPAGPDASINTRNCASCMHWGPPDKERPHMHFGLELRKCLFFTQAPEGQQPHRISHLAEVAVGWSGDKYGDLMTAYRFGCIEWTLATPA